MNYNEFIGSKIKELRTEKKLTLKQLSEQSGLSVGFLSQLERGLSSIAIDSLSKVAAILGVGLSAFFESIDLRQKEMVIHSFDRKPNPISPEIVQYILANSSSEFHMLPRVFQLLPHGQGGEDEIEMNVHEGEEFIYVLSGVVNVYVSGKEFVMYPGDSIHLHSTQKHNWVNKTNQTAEILQINFPNPFKSEMDRPKGNPHII